MHFSYIKEYIWNAPATPLCLTYIFRFLEQTASFSSSYFLFEANYWQFLSIIEPAVAVQIVPIACLLT